MREEKKGEECHGNGNTKESERSTKAETMECSVTNIHLLSVIIDAFSSENKGDQGDNKSVFFEPDGLSVIIDNSANCHFKGDIKLFPSSFENIKVCTANGLLSPLQEALTKPKLFISLTHLLKQCL